MTPTSPELRYNKLCCGHLDYFQVYSLLCLILSEGQVLFFPFVCLSFRVLNRLSQIPSLLISGSVSWPQREGLLTPAARQIHRRNFPPVGFIQSRMVLLMRRQPNPITQHEKGLELF